VAQLVSATVFSFQLCLCLLQLFEHLHSTYINAYYVSLHIALIIHHMHILLPACLIFCIHACRLFIQVLLAGSGGYLLCNLCVLPRGVQIGVHLMWKHREGRGRLQLDGCVSVMRVGTEPSRSCLASIHPYSHCTAVALCHRCQPNTCIISMHPDNGMAHLVIRFIHSWAWHST
jgi:hypothetical protein